MKVFMVLAVAAMAMMMAPEALSGPIADHAARAEKLLEAGDPVGAANALDEAVQEVWDRSPLVFRKIAIVDSATGFGIYSERDSAQFKSGDKVLIYTEPMGYTYGKNNLGNREINITAGIVIDDADGTTIFSKDDFISYAYPVRYRNREFHLSITLTLTRFPAGRYVARFHLVDNHSDKSGDFSIPFEVIE